MILVPLGVRSPPSHWARRFRYEQLRRISDAVDKVSAGEVRILQSSHLRCWFSCSQVLTRRLFLSQISHPWEPNVPADATLPRGYWADSENQRRYMDWLGNVLKVEKLSDWYRVKQREVVARGGTTFRRA